MNVKEQLEKHLEKDGLRAKLEHLKVKSNIFVFDF